MKTQIRPIEDGDIAAVAHMLEDLATRYILHECSAEASRHFLRENDEEGLRAFIAQGHVYHVVTVDGELAGFVAVRERHHLFHLFVADAYQRRGLARALWETARDAAIGAGGEGEGGGDSRFRVNASNMAVGVYESFGFVRSAPMQSKHGLFYNPMTLTVGPALLPERDWPA